jgi:PAS domain S-box-containing protein
VAPRSSSKRKGARRGRAAAPDVATLQAGLDRLPIGFALFDSRHCLVAWNEALASICGYPKAFLAAGTPVARFLRFNAERGDYGPGKIAALVRKRASMVSGRKPIIRDQRLPDGRTLRISTRSVPPAHRLITFEDVSETRLAEERYNVASRAVNEGIYDWDIKRGKIYYSERVYEALGFTARDYRTVAGWRKRIHPDDLPQFTSGVIAHLKGESERFECDYRFRTRDGSWRWARQHGIALRDASGRAIRMIGSTGDITELKRAEEALRASEERYELAVRAAAGIYDWDVSSGTLYLSPRAKEVWGFPAGPLMNTMWLEHIHPDDRAGYRQAVIDHFKGRTPSLEHEFRARGANGTYLWAHDRGICVRDGRGHAVRLVGTMNDVTGRKVAEEELRQAHEETAAALEQQTATADVLKAISRTTFDLEVVLGMLLESATRLSGAERAILLRPDDNENYLPAAQFNYPADSPLLARLSQFPLRPGRDSTTGRALLERRIVHVSDVLADAEYRRMDLVGEGEYRTVAAVPMLRDGKPTGLITFTKNDEGRGFSEKQLQLMATFADQAAIAIENVRLFNETKEALEQQKASGEVLSVISSSIADAQPVFDKITESCERLFAGFIVGLNLVGDDGLIRNGAYHGPGREGFARIFPLQVNSESGSGLAIVEARVVHYPDAQHGEEVPPATRIGCSATGIRSVIFAPVLWQGRGIGAIFVGRDFVSSFSDKEIALLRTFCDQAAIAIQNARLFREIQDKSHQLEVASHHKSQFLASMSHELRTPLNAILGFNEMILDGVYGDLPEDVKAPLENIQTSGKHLLRLINNVLDLAKIEAGRMELALSDYSVQDTVASVHSTLKPLAAEKGLDFLASVPVDLPLAYGDGGRIAQCLMNLAGNSLKFTKTGKVEISVEQVEQLLRYRVSDTGIGIPAGKIGNLFTEFKQTDATIASEYGGTGLGLSISRRFIEMHGGRIWVESEPGKGSTFLFEVPLRVAP